MLTALVLVLVWLFSSRKRSPKLHSQNCLGLSPLRNMHRDFSEQWQLFCPQTAQKATKPQNINSNPAFQNIISIDFVPLRFILIYAITGCVCTHSSPLCKWDALEKPSFNYMWAVGYSLWKKSYSKPNTALQAFQCLWDILIKLTVCLSDKREYHHKHARKNNPRWRENGKLLMGKLEKSQMVTTFPRWISNKERSYWEPFPKELMSSVFIFTLH